MFLDLFKRLEGNIRANSSRIDTLAKRTESVFDKFKSSQDLQNELKGLFSLNGYSKILDTDNVAKKVICALCLITLASACIYFVDQNIRGYKEFNVVTQIHVIENATMTFPAVTFCLIERRIANNRSNSFNRNLSDVLADCYFDTAINKCSPNDFDNFEVYHLVRGVLLNCYQFNGGRNASEQETEIKTSKVFGTRTGLTIRLNFSINDYLQYFIGDQKIRPLYTELNHFISPVGLALIGIKKTVDTKLPEPYSPCNKVINSGSSHLVRKILDQRLRYRRVYCYDLCINEYASNRNISKPDAYWKIDFNYEGNCSQYCPLRCDQVYFEISETSLPLLSNTSVRDNFDINFHFVNNKYTEMTQVVKTTESDLVSNTGGVLGLFLDISFFHVYSFLVYILDVIIL